MPVSTITLPGAPGGVDDAVVTKVRYERGELVAVEVVRSREVHSPLPVTEYLEVLEELAVDLDDARVDRSGLVSEDRVLVQVHGWRDPREDEVEAFRALPENAKS